MTRDTRDYAFDYLSAQLRMETGRNFAQIARKTQAGPQNIQHFMSHSPWSGRAVIDQVQHEIAHTPALLTGSVLLLEALSKSRFVAKSNVFARSHLPRNQRLTLLLAS